MSVVVSDTSPLHYLILCGAEIALPHLFREVVIPPTVFRELQQPNTPLPMREWARSLPAWAPDKTAQDAIVSAVSKEIAPLNTAISRLEREIELLREYRTRLVADVVTGKLDVRPAACRLPAEPVDADAEPAPDEPLEEIETEDTEV